MLDPRRSRSKVALEVFATAVMLTASGTLTVLVMWKRGIVQIAKAVLLALDGARIILVSPLTTTIHTLILLWIFTRRIIAGESQDSILEDLRARWRARDEAQGRGVPFRPADPTGGAR